MNDVKDILARPAAGDWKNIEDLVVEDCWSLMLLRYRGSHDCDALVPAELEYDVKRMFDAYAEIHSKKEDYA